MALREQVLREFKDLRQTGHSRIRVRVVQPAGSSKRYLDIREYIESPTFTNFTRRGVRLTLEEVDLLKSRIQQAQKVLGETIPPRRGKKLA